MIHQLILEANSNGWLVNNIFQLDDGSWRANLRRLDGTGHWAADYGEGGTPEEALEGAIAKLTTAEFVEAKAQAHTAAPQISLLAALGLTPAPREPLKRI